MTEITPTQRDAARSALRVIYDDLAEDVRQAGPRCDLSGRCCRFAEYDHILFLTGPEADILLADAPEPSRPLDRGDTCPWQDLAGRCTAREARPLGCRIYFCAPNYQDRSHELSEIYLNRIKEVVRKLDLDWNYAPLHHHLLKAAAEGSFPG